MNSRREGSQYVAKKSPNLGRSKLVSVMFIPEAGRRVSTARSTNESSDDIQTIHSKRILTNQQLQENEKTVT